MSIFKQTNEGDLDLSTKTLVLVTGGDELAFRMRNRTYTVRGEWFADARQGIPWFELVFIKNPRPGLIESIFDQAYRELPGMGSLQVRATVDSTTRQMSMEVEAVADDGARITGGLGTPFIAERV